jgi:putative multiple sugar transport system permease protein
MIADVEKTKVAGQGFWNIVKANLRNFSMFLVLGLIMIGFAFLTGGVNLNPRNFTYIFIQNSYILILAVGMLLVIVVGNIDLSVGSLTGFMGSVAVILFNRTGLGIVPTAVLTVLIGLIVGAYQGYWIAFVKIPAFIVTLSGMLLFRGLNYIITHVTPVTPRTDVFKEMASGTIDVVRTKAQWAVTFFKPAQGEVHLFPLIIGILIVLYIVFMSIADRRNKIKNDFQTLPMSYFLIKLVALSAIILLLSVQFARYRGLPTIVAVLGVTAVVFTFITKSTIFGRYIFAVGGNQRSAKLSGINSERVVFAVHVIMGGLCGLAGMAFAGYMNSALPDAGKDFELEAIAACFIGGASTTGGIGTVIGAIMGGLVMGTINNHMSIMNIGANWQYVVKALVLLLAVWYDLFARKKAGVA